MYSLPDVECAGCLGDLEQRVEDINGVSHARFDGPKRVLRVQLHASQVPTSSMPGQIQPQVQQHIAELLQRRGFRSQLVEETKQSVIRTQGHRQQLARLAVAGALAGNIMLFALADYGGVSGRLKYGFGLLSAALFAVVLMYCAQPLFASAWRGVKSRTLSIDFPLALAIGFGALLSYGSLFFGSGHALYFDSLAALVFLIQGSRYLQSRAESRAFDRMELATQMVPPLVPVWNEVTGGFKPTPSHQVRVGDVVLVGPGEVIGFDGELLTDRHRVYLDHSVVSGESVPVATANGAVVPAGVINTDTEIKIRVLAPHAEGRMATLLRQALERKSAKPRFVEITEKVARVYTAAVVAGSALGFMVLLPQGFDLAFSRVLAFLLVSCPCALALAVPLSYAIAQGRAARRGILIRSGQCLEKLRLVRKIFLDKTGTITKGQFQVVSARTLVGEEWFQVHISWHRVLAMIDILEDHSRHPVARALNQWVKGQLGVDDLRLAKNELTPLLSGITEMIGRGVKAVYGSKTLRIESGADSIDSGAQNQKTMVRFIFDGTPIIEFSLGDELRATSVAAIGQLQMTGFDVAILSGDSQGVVDDVAKVVCLSQDAKNQGGLSPEDKAQIVARANHVAGTMLVGDGANDSAALAEATVGVAMRGGVHSGLSAADIYIWRGGLEQLPWLFSLAETVNRNVYTALLFSVVYNICTSTAALMGYIHPLIAALLMPASSLVVGVIAGRPYGKSYH